MIDLYKHISDYYCSPVHNLQAHELSTVVRTQHVAEIQHESVAVTQHPPGTPRRALGWYRYCLRLLEGGKSIYYKTLKYQSLTNLRPNEEIECPR